MYKYLTIFLLVLIMIPACSKSGEETETTTTSAESGTEEKTLEGKSILLIVSNENFKDVEYEGTRKYLEECGADITVASNSAGECVGADGMTINADISFEDAGVSDFDAVVLIGGPGTTDHLSGNAEVHEIVNTAVEGEKVVGAICLAPMVLAEAGVLDGVKATVWESSMTMSVFDDEGVIFTGDPVTSAGRIVTANGPGAVEEFALAVEAALVKYE